MFVSWLFHLIIPTGHLEIKHDVESYKEAYTSTGVATSSNSNKEPIMDVIARHFIGGFKPNEGAKYLQLLESAYNLVVKDARKSSLIITVECRSLKILEHLWVEYKTGGLNEMAQKFLVTKDILKECGLVEVKVTTFIQEEDYRACRESILRRHVQGKCGGGGRCKSHICSLT